MLNKQLRSIITGHGGIYLDGLPEFSGTPDPRKYYFAVDGLPDGDGLAILAAMLVKQLTSGAVAPLAVADGCPSRFN